MNSPTATPIYPDQASLTKDISEWKEITKWIDLAKPREMELRTKLSQYLFHDKIQPNGALEKGTHKNKFLVGALTVAAKVVGKFNYKVLEELREATMKEAQAPDNLVKAKYELSLTQYNALTDEQKKIVDKMIEVRPGAPELSIEIS